MLQRRTSFAALCACLLAVASAASSQQTGADAQIRAEFQKVLGPRVEDLSDKGKQDLDALVKNMGPQERQAAQARLAELEAKAGTPAAKAQLAKAYTALARQAAGRQAVDLALKARALAPSDSEVRVLTDAVLKMARDAESRPGESPAGAVASLQKPQQTIVNNIYVIMVNDSQKGKDLASKFSKGQVEVRIDGTGRLKDSIVEASWEGEGSKKKLVVSLDEDAIKQNKHAPATLAPLVAKALDNGDFIREHGDGIISQVEMAVRGWFSTGKVGDQIMTKGKNPIDTKSGTAGKIVGFFVDLFRGKMTEEEYGDGIKDNAAQSARLNVGMKRERVERFAAVSSTMVGAKDSESGATKDPNYYKNLTTTKNLLKQEQ